jgi:hypothetical protein
MLPETHDYFCLAFSQPLANIKGIENPVIYVILQVEGRYIESPRSAHLLPALKDEHKGACPLCCLNLNVDYTVGIQFFKHVHMR